MSKICFLLTTTPWWDQRQYFKQAPALAQGDHDVIFMAGEYDTDIEHPFDYIVLKEKQRKIARLTGGLNLFITIRRLNPNAIQLCSIEQLPLGIILRILTQIKVIYDCREDHPSAMRDHKDYLPKYIRRVMYYVSKFLEYIAARLFDGLIVSDPALFKMHSAAKPEKKIIFYNVPLLSHFNNKYLPLIKRRYDIVLLGSMSEKSGILTVIKAIGLLASRGKILTLLLIGAPARNMNNKISECIKKYMIESQIEITGKLKYFDVPNILSQAKIGVTAQIDLPKFRKNIACKIFEYMACGIPSVCSDLPPQRFVIKENKTGLFFKPGDHVSLANVLSLLSNDLSFAQKMGNNGRIEFENKWNAEKEQIKYCKFYKKIFE